MRAGLEGGREEGGGWGLLLWSAHLCKNKVNKRFSDAGILTEKGEQGVVRKGVGVRGGEGIEINVRVCRGGWGRGRGEGQDSTEGTFFVSRFRLPVYILYVYLAPALYTPMFKNEQNVLY